MLRDTHGGWTYGKTGIWLIGARGSVATTAVMGLAAIAAGLAKPLGCVTEHGDFRGVHLPNYADLVVGGHDISGVCMAKRAEKLVDAGMVPGELFESVRPQLLDADSRVRPGYDPVGGTESQADAALRLSGDILAFREINSLQRVIVLDVASTEAPPDHLDEFDDVGLLKAALQDPARSVLPASSVAAYAAVLAGSPYICFTPSTALNIPALHELAGADGVPTAGQDGKTGQTWLRSVLAPALSARGLRVLSWAGTNLLGGGDGATLADSRAVSAKLQSKNRGLRELTGGAATPLHIDNVPDLGETKVAWDHIHVEGFLGSRLTIQTTWSAYDSMLAAPMVLDLARLMALADAAGETGHVGALGFFFKDPWGSDEHSFAQQTNNLVQWAHGASGRLTANTDGDQP
ncbi:inositol-3-phosphate synthase [Arthrobacter sp. zg-Y820]|uniref:inositol-3-phosphate synthase n=1 Tax=unclassified Arthrobacter TaxID=235627 RepID=UPI001E311EB2|nr:MULTISPECIES: inositol-3-phosphate synthase [unclassified Arthrobacter]MCC9196907.1 inositol-3-phosphate synthase [Arthrobacter sp. zg-Y820]MDK1279771.1 inositol-3-phosphate synthase [Arthrobacter sp. zg.Y820]MDK1361904.1 inositol-3-phosphate synthase [Arthrobacter sp. zg-Y1219]WIB10975.1 inositol-3-phosphate synthase [Arthrobacter sp. zg-Y820]